jgi:hypothetical protein
VISVPAGAKLGAWWGHVIGGAQGPNDPDHPIAASHKGSWHRSVKATMVTWEQIANACTAGPIQYYLAKVDNAATTGTTGLQWFKVAHDGLSNGKWAVDTMIANGGWHYFNMPTCVAPGDYLLRVELIALHSASTQGNILGPSFYDGADSEQVAPSSIWNAHRSASRVAVQTKAQTLCLSPVPIRPMTLVSKSVSMILLASRTWAARPTRSQDLHLSPVRLGRMAAVAQRRRLSSQRQHRNCRLRGRHCMRSVGVSLGLVQRLAHKERVR